MSKRILLVDDEKDIIQVMRKRILAAGYDVDVAYNGKEGLELTQDHHPHLILTDVAMPVMDGFAFYYEVKCRQDVSHIPIIVATAHGTMEDVFRGLGVKDFLFKPFTVQHALDKINAFFTQQKAYKILIATKMHMLMHGILDEVGPVADKLDVRLSNNQLTLADEAEALNPDLIILDVDMFFKPSADEVVSQLRQKESLKETVILLNRSMLGHLAGLAGSQHRADKTIDECLASGASHYVGLINTESFLSVIDEYCR